IHFTTDLYKLPLEPNQARPLGKLEPVTDHGGAAQLPALATYGSKIVYVSDRSGRRDLWIHDLDAKWDGAVTAFRPIGFRPVISADGIRIIYRTLINDECAVLMQDASMGSPVAPLKGCFSIWDWSADGAGLLTFQSADVLNTVELIRLPSEERRVVLTSPRKNIYDARFSPDGRWIAFASGRSSGSARLFIAPLRSSP